MRFLSGLLNQDKFLPIRYCPITIEIELVNQMTDPIITQHASSPDVAYQANISQTWAIQNVMVKADVITLDNTLDNEYAQHLLEGKTLPISYNTYVSQLLSLQTSSGNFTANITRSFTRLKSVFATFMSSTKVPNVTYGQTRTTWNNDFGKDWNQFYHPMLQNTSTQQQATYHTPQQMNWSCKSKWAPNCSQSTPVKQ
jgi:hypothetical protein